MEFIIQPTSWHRWTIRTARRKLPPHLQVVFIVLLGLTLVIVAVRALAQNTLPSPNPFSAFADVFPGQPQSAAELRGIPCMINIESHDDLTDESCAFVPATGIFRRVQVAISRGVIRQITFIVQQNALRLGDLSLFWGTPEIRNYGRSTILSWRDCGIIALVPDTSQSLHFASVWSVHVTDTATCLS